MYPVNEWSNAAESTLSTLVVSQQSLASIRTQAWNILKLIIVKILLRLSIYRILYIHTYIPTYICTGTTGEWSMTTAAHDVTQLMMYVRDL